MVRWIAIVLLVVVAALGFVAWKRYAAPAPAATAGETPGMPSGAAPEAAAEAPAEPGVHWTVPAAWKEGSGSSMRLATYLVGDGANAAECAVFYFGANQGGTVDENIDRWAGQFEGSPNPKRTKLQVDGLDVIRVQIDGAYLSPGMDMQSQGTKHDWRMLGAIVQGPNGPLFFKLTGPAATLKSAEKDFDALLQSLHAH